MPPELTGLYTDASVLQKEVDRYLERLAKVEEGKRIYARNARFLKYEEKSKAKKFNKRLQEVLENATSITSQ